MTGNQTRSRTSLFQRFLAMLMAFILSLGFFPLNVIKPVFAANGAIPTTITLKEAKYRSREEGMSYTSNKLGTVYFHTFKFDIGDRFPQVAFCFNHSKEMGSGYIGETWTLRQGEVVPSACLPYLDYFYQGIQIPGDQSWGISPQVQEAVNAWVQDSVWLAQRGLSGDALLEALVTEREKILSLYGPYATGNSREILTNIVGAWKDGNIPRNTYRVFYHSSNDLIQPVLIAFRRPPEELGQKAYVTVKKKIDNKGNPLGGINFVVYEKNPDLCPPNQNKRLGMITTNGKTGRGSTAEIFLPMGTTQKTVYVREELSPFQLSLYKPDPTVHTVQLDAKLHTIFNPYVIEGVAPHRGSNGEIINDTREEDYDAWCKLIKHDEKEGRPLGGAKFGVYADEACTQSVIGGLLVESGPDDGFVLAHIVYKAPEEAKKKTVYMREEVPPPGYVLDQTPYPITIDPDVNKTAETAAVGNGGVAVTNYVPEDAWFYILKHDADGNPLANAKFAIYADKECQQRVFGDYLAVSGPDGKAWGHMQFKGKEGRTPRTYYMREEEVPLGYILDQTPYPVTFDSVSNATEQTAAVANGGKPVLNYLKEDAWFYIIKHDADGKPLADAKFAIYADQACQQRVFGDYLAVSGPDGKAWARMLFEGTEGRTPRTYYMREEFAPPGYVLDPTPYPVTFDSVNNGEEKTAAVANNGKPVLNRKADKVAYIQLKKTSDTGAPLAGAIFGVYADEGHAELIGKMTTDQAGAANMAIPMRKDEETRTVHVEELEAPPGFERKPGNVSVTVNAKENATPETAAVVGGPGHVFKNKKSEFFAYIRVEKVNEGNKPLSGAEFTVYSDSAYQNKVGMITTDAGGKGFVKVSVSQGGDTKTTFYVKETRPPDGYELLNDEFKVQVSANANGTPETAALVNGAPIKNKPKEEPAVLEIHKKDDQGKYLAGAKFSAYNAEHNQTFESNVTGSNGVATITIPAQYVKTKGGAYTTWEITEIVVPEGFDPIGSFTMTCNESKAIRDVVNTKKPPEGIVQKVDQETGAPLGGAVMLFRDGKGIEKSVVTNEWGNCVLQWWNPGEPDYLPPGTYTVTEATPPPGYNKTDEVKHITLKYDPVTAQATHTGPLIFTDTKRPYIELVKTDMGGKPLNDAQFDVYFNGKYYDHIDMAGKSKVQYSGRDGQGLEDGFYEFVEVVAPDGYIIDNKRHRIEVDVKDHAVDKCIGTIAVKNDIGKKIKIIKTDALNPSIKLPGAKFEVYIDGQECQAALTTDADGYAVLTESEFGKFLDESKDSWTVQVKEIAAPNGYYLPDDPVQEKELKRGTKVLEFAFSDVKKPFIKLMKTDPENNFLAGAEFDVYKDGTLIDHIKVENPEVYEYHGSDNKGLDKGLYKFVETIAPKGYMLAEKPVEIMVTGNENPKDGCVGTVSFVNHKGIDIKVYKQSTDKKPLAGAVFKVKIDDVQCPKELITDDSGYAVLEYEDLKGFLDEKQTDWVVTMEEISPPAGYMLPDERVHTKTLKKGMKELGFTFEDAKYPTIKVYKQSMDDPKIPLAGAVFKVWIDGKECPKDLITDDTGYAEVKYEDLRNFLDTKKSSWTIRMEEISAPSGYLLPEIKIQEKELKKDVKELKFVYEDAKYPEIHVLKRDAETGDVLKGAEFRILVDGEEISGPLITDDKGMIKITYDQYHEFLHGKDFDGIPVTVTEIKAPENYNRDQIPEGGWTQTQTLKYNQSVVEFTFTDHHYRNIRVTKSDAETGWMLKGAEFKLHCESLKDASLTKPADKIGTTDETGTVVFKNIPNGHYTITEVTPPAGYRPSGIVKEVDVTDSSDQFYIEVSFENKARTGLTIRKIDSVAGQPIPGVSFTITGHDNEGNFVDFGEKTTDGNGLIVIENINPGQYTITETAVPPGFILDPTPHVIEVKDEHQSTTFIQKNDAENTLYVLKLNSKTKLPVPGVTFSVSTAGGYHVANITTGVNGYAILPDLKPGSYVVKEIFAPDNMILDPTVQTFEVKEGDSGKIYTLTFYNDQKINLLLQKIDKETGKPLEGAYFDITKANGEIVAENQRTDHNGVILLPNQEPGIYIVKEIRAPEGYVLNDTEMVVVLRANETKKIVIENSKKGGMMICKVDAQTKLPVPGAAFELYTINDQRLGVYSDDDKDGYINISGLEAGQYVIHEIRAPEGYILSNVPIKVKVEEFKITKVTVENTNKSVLSVMKIDSDTGMPVPGAKIRVMKMDGEVVKTGTTDGYGKLILTGLEPGWYKVQEYEAPKGYILDDTVHTVEIKEGIPGEIQMKNKAEKGLLLRKYDGETMGPLGGVTFEIFTLDDKLVGEYTTDAAGAIDTIKLAPGRYKVHETKAPEGYLKDESWVYFEMVDGETTLLNFKNYKKTVILVEKQDKDTGEYLAGAVFEVRTADGKTVIGTYTTDATGTVSTIPLEPGTYTVREIKAPEGYQLNNEVKTVVVEKGRMPEVVKFLNAKMEITIIEKVDAQTGKPLEGAVFQLYALNGSVIGKYKTGADGIVMLPALDPGAYAIREIQAPDGYMIDNICKFTFEIESGHSSHLTFTDTKKPGLQILKVDSVTGDPLAGAQFELFTTDGTRIKQDTTDENGTLIYENIEPGTYVLIEKKAPEGYVLDQRQYLVTMKPGETVVLTATNTAGSTLNLKKTDEFGNSLAGAVFMVIRKSDGKNLGRFTTDATGCLAIENLLPGEYEVVEVLAPNGYVIDTVSKTITLSKGEQGYIGFINKTLTGIEIMKVDAVTKKPLAGAVFEIRTSTGELIETLTTDIDGVVDSQVLQPGTYTVEETKAPDGYDLNPDKQTVEVKTGTTTKIIVENTRQDTLHIHKVDALTNQSLAGAEFEIKTVRGKLVGTYTTDSDGMIVLPNLSNGYYLIYETKAPAGYRADPDYKLVNLDGSLVELTISNMPEMGILIEKVDAVTKAPLGGASFEIKDNSGKVVFTGTTDQSGTLATSALAAGVYTLTETAAPEGYVTSGEAQTITVENGIRTTIRVENSPLASLTVKKVDAETKDPLAGASFEVKSDNGVFTKTVTTDSTGIVILTGLAEGAYSIREIKAPEGYLLNPDHIDFNVKSGTDNVVTMENSKSGSLVIRKTDKNTGLLLQGAKFTVTAADGTIAYTGTTDASGIIMTGTLTPGTYTVTEISAPDGYLLDSKPQTVEIKLNEIKTIEFQDSPLASILIEKVDSVTKEMLPGARFKLTRLADNKVIQESVTDVDGLALINDLEPGRYMIEEVVAPEGYVMETEPIMTDVELGKVAHVTFFNAPKTGIIIDSIDKNTKEPLSGSVFEIWLQNGGKLHVLTTDTTGKVETPPLEPGYYVIKQTIVQDGYRVIINEQTVEVKAGQPAVHVVFEAVKGYTLRIENVDAQDRHITIQNAEFTVTKIDGTLIGSYLTDINGQIMVPGLEAGWYIVTQSIPGKGYILNEQSFNVEVKAGTIATVLVRNEPLKGLVINLYDKTTNEGIKDAIFEVWEQNGDLVGTFTTDSTGRVETNILVNGTYVIKQIFVPDGYKPVTKDQTITLNGNTSTVIFYNQQKTTITMEATDDKTFEPIAGVKFEVYLQNGELVGTYVTDKTGKIETEALPDGYYVIKQIHVPYGYAVNGTDQTIRLEDVNVTVSFTNRKLIPLVIEAKDQNTSEPLEGAQFQVYDQHGNLLGTFTTDSTGRVETGILVNGKYTIKQLAAPDGYGNDGKDQIINLGTTVFVVSFENRHLSNITIELRDNQHKPLSGGVFEIRVQNGETVGTFTTDKTGRVETETLPRGYYVIHQISAPAGHAADHQDQTVYLDQDSILVEFENQMLTHIVVEAADKKSGELLEGAVFKVYRQNGQEVGTFTTDSTGRAETGVLPAGYYIIKQMIAPHGYEIETEEKTVHLDRDTAVIRFLNQKLVHIVIELKDRKTSEPIPGGEFEVYQEDGTLVGTFVTDQVGRVDTETLTPGHYTIIQTKAPDGYIPEENEHELMLTDRDYTAIFRNEKLTNLVIEAKDHDTSENLAGAEFQISAQNGNQIGTFVTDASGRVETELLEEGYYVIRQIRAPEGYTPDPHEQTVLVNASGSQIVTFYNGHQSTLTIRFEDAGTTAGVSGAKFDLKEQNGDYVGEFVTGAGGAVTTPILESGFYEITYKAAPDGYTFVPETQTIEIRTGAAGTVTFRGTAQSSIRIELKDELHKALPGAEFEVKHIDGTHFRTVTTQADGSVTIPDVSVGYYVIRQTKAPDGYEVDPVAKTIEVKSSEVVDVTFFNQSFKGAVIYIRDSKAKPVSGVKIEIREQNGNVIGTYLSDQTGTINANSLTPGYYVVKIVALPDGYQIKNLEQTVEITAKEAVQITFDLVKQAGVVLKNLNKADESPLAGAHFTLTTAEGTLFSDSVIVDHEGIAVLGNLNPGYYVLTQTKAPDGFVLNEEPLRFKMEDNKDIVLTFYNAASCGIEIMAMDHTGTGLPGMTVSVSLLNGTKIGEYTTDASGIAVINDLMPDYYVIKEVKTPEGYMSDPAPKTVEVKSGMATKVAFQHSKVFGLQILTTAKQTQQPVSGVVYSVEKLNGERIGVYTSDLQGIVYVNLVPDTYVVRQISAPDGYKIDKTAHNVNVIADQTTNITYTVEQQSSMNIHIVDAQTGAGIYNVRFLLKQQNGMIIGEYITNDQGYIKINRDLRDGYYLLEAISAPVGYTVDGVPRTIQILNGQTTEINWSFGKNAGQVQIVVTSAEMNQTLNKPANSPLSGAEFEIVNPDNYAVVDTIKTGADGVAASQPLPLGRYIVKQKTAAPYYSISNQETEVKLKVPNDIVRVEYKNNPVTVSLKAEMKSNNNVNAGSSMRVDFIAVNNESDSSLNDFFWQIKVPTDCARAGTLYTGSWNKPVWYQISYKTNMRDFTNVSGEYMSTNQNQIDVSSTALGLQTGEYVTDIRMTFGKVPSGFNVSVKPAFYMYVLPDTYNGYKCITRTEIGGKIGNEWETATATWTTNVIKNQTLPDRLPTTGF